MNATRQRFLQDRVLTATPAQRVVMLYDRLALDLARAQAVCGERAADERRDHCDHAFQIVAELLGSLDQSVGGPAANLAQIYGYLLNSLLEAQLRDGVDLAPVVHMVDLLRSAWTAVAAGEGGLPATAMAGAGWTA